MNIELLESFGQNHPEEFDGVLDCVSLAVTCSFNRWGSLLAVGCNDGRIVIWDFLTRGIAKIISAHVHPVCSLSWSRSGQKLVSVSTDNNVCIWDVLSGECDMKYRFPSPILKVQFHPRNEKIILICPMRHPGVLLKIDEGHEVIPLDDEGDVNIVASFNRRGNYIYTGNSKGKILALSCPDLEIKASFRIVQGATSASAIKSIEFARRTEFFLVNSADRVIRVYDSKTILKSGIDGDPEPIQKLQDLVNKTMWKKCCFSGDGEYICAGSARQHSLYIWERSIGNLVKILHGTKGEMLLDVVWHPVRPIVASISSGVVSVWSQNQVENWSAFAPDFKELDENVEYEERESEFDQNDEDKSVELSQEREDEDVEPVTAFCSSDEEDDTSTLLYLPISPEIEEPEEGWGPEGAPIEDMKRSGEGKENASPKKKRAKTYDVNLENAPLGEVHPLSNTRPREKQGGGGKKGRAYNST
ncbi:Retinoblastoma-binding protein 5-like protein [Armadillidium nasatum]|uniref:Retinoblastoma-binding protein 5-like protein n=1 Tax=Armadillidium nasatum TaxID=96803 RepID=A0A5N5SPP3_9CRUS|nr:Retinoblastoma-binding protein 5-like protein [Armadillidium nasatum]